MGKVKVATVWLGGCSGCHMSFLDLDENLFELAKLAEITSSPITDIKKPPRVDLALVEGAVADDHSVEVLKELREQATVLIAFGDCACYGNVPAMRNAFALDEILERGYVETESTFAGEVPESEDIPTLLEKLLPINAVVKVDGYIPGCPPSADTIFFALSEAIQGRVPRLMGDKLRYD